MITITQHNDEYIVKFPYDIAIINIVKVIPGRRWDADRKLWLVPNDKLGWLVRLLNENGYSDQVKIISNEQLGVNQTLDTTTDIPEIDLSNVHFYVKDGCKPYPHQLDFMKWAIHREAVGNRSGFVLADEPGLGKTLEVLNLAMYNREVYGCKHCLIVCCINSAKYHWRNDIIEHTDGEEIPYILGSRVGKRSRIERCNGNADKLADLRCRKQHGDPNGDDLPFFIVTNIECIRIREGNSYPIADELIEMINSGYIGMIALDEIHKNASPSSLQGKQLLRIKKKTGSGAMWIPMTGTPITNKPTDVFTPLKLVDGHRYSSYFTWCQEFCVYGGYGDHEIVGYKNISYLKSLLQNNMLRRLKSDVLKDLPPKIRFTEYVENSPYQEKLYKTVLGEILADRAATVSSLNPLSQLMRLRQVNGSPEIIDDSLNVFNPTEYLKRNAKLVRLLELLQDIHERGEKVVIFSNWVEPLRTLYRYIASKYKVCAFTGTMTLEAREASKHQFMTDPATTVLIATIGAGGTAQTFTAANNVIFYDSPWTPADKEQAEDRIHRISTTTPVNIYTLVTANTVDERVENILYTKKSVSNYIVDNKLDLHGNPALFDYLLGIDQP